MAELKDETGNRYGRLTVLRKYRSDPHRRGMTWICRCDCGQEIAVLGSHLRNGNTRSCGCRRKDAGILAAERINRRKKEDNMDDTISRGDVLETLAQIYTECLGSEERIVIAAYSAVKDLPGKTPPVVTCGECRHWLTSYAAEYSSSGRCGLNGIAREKGFFCAEGER